MRGLMGILLLVLIILISGCTQTGRIVDVEEYNLTPEEELILKEFLNKTPEISDANETEQNISPVSGYAGHTEPQNITQPLGCPETCDDGDGCTYDYCSKDTGYECVHAVRICPSFVKICPDGVRVICENTCIDDACTRCKPDCTEHQLPVCELTQDDCGACQILDTENCECAQIISCVNNDGCCPEGCDYSNDNDCEEPEGECHEDMDCDDSNNCTIDRCEGIPRNCSHEEITECKSDDGCCPEGCDYANDTDCKEPPEEPEITGGYLIINEIMYNPIDEAKEEFIELYNPSSNPVDVYNWSISDNVQADNLDTFNGNLTIISPGSYAVITDDDSNITIPEGVIHLTTGHNAICYRGLKNTGENITLIHSNGTIMQQIDYSPYSCDNGYSLERVSDDWDCSIQIGGTPGSENNI